MTFWPRTSESARRKGAKNKGRRAPWYRLSPDHFQKFKRMLAPDWGQKCFLFLYPNREHPILSSFRLFVHDGYCLAIPVRFVRSPRLCLQGKLSYLLIFPNKKRRNYRWLGKTFRMLSAGTFQFAPWNFRRAFSLDPTDCPWVSEDDEQEDIKKELSRLLLLLLLLLLLGWLPIQFPNPRTTQLKLSGAIKKRVSRGLIRDTYF